MSDWLGWLWFLIKVFIGIFLFVWIRSTYPRLRLDQIMAVCWKFLMPLSIINLAAVVLEVFFLRDANGSLEYGRPVDNGGHQYRPGRGGSILFFGRFIREKVRTEAPHGNGGEPGGAGRVDDPNGLERRG